MYGWIIILGDLGLEGRCFFATTVLKNAEEKRMVETSLETVREARRRETLPADRRW